MPSPKDFQEELVRMIGEAEKQGLSSIEINSGALHRKVGGYPGNSHRMPSCCEVMRQYMKSGDVVIKAPPKGNGASLTIKYKLPR